MKPDRRTFVQTAGALGALAAFGGLLLAPARALAAWNKSAFQAKTTAEGMMALGITQAQDTKDIVIRAPEIAENGAVVPIDITSNIPGTRRLSVFIEKNPFPYTGTFEFAEGAVPYVHLRVKIGETSPVRVVAEAGGKFYTTVAEVKVTIGGCG